MGKERSIRMAARGFAGASGARPRVRSRAYAKAAQAT
jgi:hypothetical protein